MILVRAKKELEELPQNFYKETNLPGSLRHGCDDI